MHKRTNCSQDPALRREKAYVFRSIQFIGGERGNLYWRRRARIGLRCQTNKRFT